MIKILTDSTADLPRDYLERYHIAVVPLTLTWQGCTYVDDGVNLNRRELYQKLRGAKQLPITSQPSLGDFDRVYRELTADGSEVLFLTISSEMSGTSRAARSAADALPAARICVYDTRHVSVALAVLVLWAAQMAAAGATLEQITASLDRLLDRSGIVFLVDSLEYLRLGGRIGTAAAMVGTLLNVKPLLTVRDGLIQPLCKVRTKKLAKEQMLAKLDEQVPAGSRIWGGVAHCDNPEEAQWMAEELRRGYDCAELFVAEMGPVVGTHVGPGLFGCAIFPMDGVGQ